MSGGGVAFSQALQSQGNTNSSEPVVKYRTGGGIADLNRNVDSKGIRHFIEGGYTDVGDVEGIDAYDSANYGGKGFVVTSNTDVNNYLNLGNLPTPGQGLLLAGGNNNTISDAGSGFTMPTDSTYSTDLNDYDDFNPVAVGSELGGQNLPGAFGETIPQSVVDAAGANSIVRGTPGSDTYSVFDSDTGTFNTVPSKVAGPDVPIVVNVNWPPLINCFN
jgi:hypothetical protein